MYHVVSLIMMYYPIFLPCPEDRGMENLDETIVLTREALDLYPPGHCYRSVACNDFAIHFARRFAHQATLIEVLFWKPFLFARFAQSGQSNDREEMFGLYAQLGGVPQGVRAAEHFQHPTTLLAYETSLRFLVQHFTILLSLRHQLNFLQKLTLPLAVDASSASLRHGSPAKAFELLEQGRTVIWSQLVRLRSPLDEAMTAWHLALQERSLQTGSNGNQRDRGFQRNIELQRVATKIHGSELPGLSRFKFLESSLFTDLRQVARDGPVIVVNASQYGCDALVILLDRDPVRIPLQITQEHNVDATRGLAPVLRQLWDGLISPIVKFLRTIHPCQSRIWWCPTTELSLLPFKLHAAGPFRNGKQNVSDIYISSYPSTLSALIHARRPSTSNSNSEKKRLLASPAFKRIERDECSISRVSEEFSKTQWVYLACDILPDEDQPLKAAFYLHDGSLTIQHFIQCELDNPEFAYLSASHTVSEDKRIPDEAMHLASAMMFGQGEPEEPKDLVDD
ncbi:hypothetical protein V8E55_003167 [Tylopilus felleus]